MSGLPLGPGDRAEAIRRRARSIMTGAALLIWANLTVGALRFISPTVTACTIVGVTIVGILSVLYADREP